MAPDVLTLSLGGFPGSSTALAQLAEATGTTQHVRAPTSDGRSPEMTFVRHVIRKTPPRLLILGGWSDAYDPIVDLAVRHRVAVAVYWTSTFGQTEIARDVQRLDRVMNDARIRFRWFTHRGLGRVMAAARKDCAWLPALLPPRTPRPRSAPRRARRREAQISLFCSPHEYHRKNVLNSLAAVSALTRPYRLHLNGLSAEPLYRAWLDRLGVTWIDHGWMARERYDATIAELDLGLQVSFAESFNYVAADHVLAGVPVVVSPMVACVAELAPKATRGFVVDHPDDPEDVTRAIAGLLARDDAGRGQAALAAAALRTASVRHLSIARRVLRSALSST